MTASDDGAVRLFDLRNQGVYASAVLPRAFGARCADFDKATSILAVGGADVRVFAITPDSLTTAGSLDGHSEPVTGVRVLQNSILSVSLDRSLKVWSV